MKALSIIIPSKTEPKILETLCAVEEHFPFAQVVTANDRYGKGKGWAMREALSLATGNIICFLDADGDIHPRMLWRLIPFIDGYDIVVGKKKNTGSLPRRLITLLSRIFIKALFGLSVDTQTGIKVFRKEAISEWETNGFMFDVEILAKAKKRNLRIIEISVDAKRSKGMKVSSIIRCLIEAVKIRRMV